MTQYLQYIIPILQSLFLAALSPLAIGIIRKTKAVFQNRVGASIFQPYRDLRKLFSKNEIIPQDSSWIFSYTPYVIFAITLILGTSLPLFTQYTFQSISDFIVIIYLLGLSAFLISLAGMDSGSAFGGFGSSRELSLNAITEGVLLFSLLPLALIFHTTNMSAIILSSDGLLLVAYLPIAIAGMGYLIALTVENARIPVDNPTTHLELTMIHEAMILEYSGKRLALIEWASWNKLLFFFVLGAQLYLPWSKAATSEIGTNTISLLILAANVVLLILLLAFVESVIAKFRIFRVPDMIFTGLALGMIATLIIIFL